MIKLTNEEKLQAGVAVLQGDQFQRDNALLFMIDNEYCALQMIGSPDSCKKFFTNDWEEALRKFEEFREAN